MAATQAQRSIRWVKGRSGDQPEVFFDTNIVVASAQTFKAGDLVTITPGTGTIAVAGSAGAVTTIPHIAGIAMEDAVPATGPTNIGQPIHILRITQDDVFVTNICSGATMTTATAITQLGVCYGLYRVAATASTPPLWLVDTNDTTAGNCRVKIVGFVYGVDTDASGNQYQKAIGDATGEVYIKFLSDDGTNLQILDLCT